MDDAGGAPGILIEGDRPQLAGAQPGVQADQRILPGARQVRDREDARVGQLGPDVLKKRLVGHAQSLVHYAPARLGGEVHRDLAVLIAARQGGQLLVELAASG